MAWGPDIGITFTRNSSKDVTLLNPLKTVYTDSTTLTNGMSVYDNTGTDTGYVVTNINNNTFDIAETADISFSCGYGISGYSIDNTSYTGNNTVTVTKDETHTLEPSFSSYERNIALNGNDIGDDISFEISGNNITFTGDGGMTQQTTYTTTISTTIEISSFNCCIPYYIEVNYYDGTTKTAEEVKIGDKLLGYNESTNQFEEVEVLNIIHKLRNELVTVKTNNYEIEITPDHPILTNKGWAVYDLNTSNYQDLEKIHLNNSLKVLTKDGNYEDIISIDYKELENPIDTYTYNVTEGIDTYVSAGIISHNAPC